MSQTVGILRPTKHDPASGSPLAVSGFAVREEIRASVLKSMLDWLHMRPLDPSKANGHADYVVFLADEVLDIEYEPRLRTSKAIALLPHNFSRGRTENLLAQKFAIYETITAPFGPRKLARAIAACESTAASRQNSASKILESSALSDADADKVKTPSYADQDQQTLQIIPQNADHTLSARSSGIQTAHELTMPTDGADKENEGIQTADSCKNTHLPQLAPPMHRLDKATFEATLEDAAHSPAPVTRGIPRLLLVDDNKINLSLLETFVRKQKRKLLYDCAENGLLAVNAARQNSSGYNIIFMDVSMPVMDGLEATREIRKLEKERIARLGEDAAPPPALVVALTGLANGRDQVDAFASGVDLFLTKPTKFKEIGSLIEEWFEKGSQNIGSRRVTLQNG
jgi:CheY-like chemotaxis protein